MSTPPGRMALSLIVFLTGACTAHTSLVTRSQSETQYLEAWERDWRQIGRDLEPLAPSATSPGACNQGGSQILCKTVSETLLSDFEQLDRDLKGGWVPNSLRSANESIRKAIAAQVQALRLRIAALEHGDDSEWQQANDLFRQVGPLFAQAYEEFPSDLKPIPPPTY